MTTITISDDLKERCREILEWKKTGILPGEALRTRARELRTKLQDSFDMGQVLHMAEQATFRELMEVVVGVNKETR